MSLVCLILGALCLLYFAVIAVYAGPAADFSWFWIVLGLSLLVVVYLGKSNSGVMIWVRRILLAVICTGAVFSAAISVTVIKAMNRKAPADLKYVIVLGAQVRGTKPSRALRRRLEKAVEYAEDNPDTVLILSGGQGENEDISEAECMKNYLIDADIPESRLILEDRSASTRENLLFSDELTGCAAKPCGIISNNFHIFRAVSLAEKLGYSDPEGIPAGSDPVMQVHFIVRETAAIAAEKLKGEI